ncbi:MAG: DoxX family membrane protein, partial [Gemmatimonadales bacterium]
AAGRFAASLEQLEGADVMNRFQTASLVTLRMLVGWHFCYEGLAKLLDPYWTSAGYLSASQWWFKGLFIHLSANPTAMRLIDGVNAWGLALIGLLLIVGSLNRIAAVAGMALLFLYYIAAPPLVGLSYPIPAEGAYLIVNKVLIELAALWVLLVFPTARQFGLDALLHRRAAGQEPSATQA